MLNIFYSNTMEGLLESFYPVLDKPVGGPFVQEVTTVQSLEMRMWLSMQIAKRFGVVANFKMPLPRDLLEELVSTVLGETKSPFAMITRDYLTWAVMRQISELVDEPDFKRLKAYIAGDTGGRRAFAIASKISSVFDMYIVFRSDMLLRWEQGVDDGWQSVLWRAIIANNAPEHFAHRLKQLTQAIDAGTLAGSLPARINIFGVTTLPPMYMKMLTKIAILTEINFFVLTPTREFFGDVRKKAPLISNELGVLPNPLIASMGKLGREFQQILLESIEGVQVTEAERFSDPLDGVTSNMLHIIQSDIFNLLHRLKNGVNFAGQPIIPVSADPSDHSISIHSCHNSMREVEVLKDQLLSLFDNPDLGINPEDIVVMAPEIEEFAPLVEAVFGGKNYDQEYIPFKISDRFVLKEEAAVEAFLETLELLRSRFKLEKMLDLLAKEPVHSRFKLSSSDVETCRNWLINTNIRWGIDEDHRDRMGQPAARSNTWAFGLDRLMLGFATPVNDKELNFGVLPYAELEGQDYEILGKLVRFTKVLFKAEAAIQKKRSLPKWKSFLEDLTDELLLFDGDSVEQRINIVGELERQVLLSGEVNFDEALSFEVVMDMINATLGSRKSSRAYLSSGVTFCDLQPLRSIPFKVICLLGMNDTAFPRSTKVLGFDLTGVNPQAGDRNRRDDDKYLFLESILSARSNLIITYTGRSSDNKKLLPPSAVVSELIDVINESFIDKTILKQHPLQPYSPSYFDNAGELFSYSKDMLQGAKALLKTNSQVKPEQTFQIAPLADDIDEPTEIHLKDLVSFFKLPAKFFLTRQLGIGLSEAEGEIDSREPIELNNLESYWVGQKFVEGSIKNNNKEDIYRQLAAEGVLPIGTVGQNSFEKVAEKAHDTIKKYKECTTGTQLQSLKIAQTVRVHGKDIIVRGSVGDLWSDARVVGSFGSLKPKRYLEAWIYHVALNAQATKGYPKASILIGPIKNGKTKVVNFSPISTAEEILADLVSIFLNGLRAALPFTPELSFAYAKELRSQNGSEKSAMDKALVSLNSNNYKKGNDNDPFICLAFRGRDFGDDNFAINGEMIFKNLAQRVFDPYFECTKESKK